VFQQFQAFQEFQEFQEIATHFKSVSRDSKRQQEFQEHVSRVTNFARLNHLGSLPDVAGAHRTYIQQAVQQQLAIHEEEISQRCLCNSLQSC